MEEFKYLFILDFQESDNSQLLEKNFVVLDSCTKNQIIKTLKTICNNVNNCDGL